MIFCVINNRIIYIFILQDDSADFSCFNDEKTASRPNISACIELHTQNVMVGGGAVVEV